MHSNRQQNLFATEVSQHVLTAFTDLHFQSYDYSTIRNAMVEYIVRTFPEDYNDYIESSEFVAIIELLAYLGQSLSFRMDMNTKENFLGSATRKESVLALAKMLNYSPQRNLPASGLLRLSSVSTTETVISPGGVNLKNRTILWDDPDNEDYYEQLLAVLNAAFSGTNQFGSPYKVGTLDGIDAAIYNINVIRNIQVKYGYEAEVSGENVPFEVTGASISDFGFVEEQVPDPSSALSIVYLSDGLGNSSSNTGFFFHFRQGSLTYEDHQFEVPAPNRTINVDVSNINHTDIVFQEITPNGLVKHTWTQVPYTSGTSVIYNSLSKDQRKIFSVDTQLDDKITIKFADGNFGEAPVGLFRLWYRTSANTRMQIQPEDMGRVVIDIPYVDRIGNAHSLSVTLKLEKSVTNSVASETQEEIKARASALYHTQNRAITSSDYNVFPLISNPDIKKIRAINRTHAGHSRFIDINDPTGATQNLTVHADDGIIYKDFDDRITFTKTASAVPADQIIKDGIEPLLSKSPMTNFFYDTYSKGILERMGTNFLFFEPSDRLIWIPKPNADNSSTGYFITSPNYSESDPILNELNAQLIGTVNAVSPYDIITEKSLLELQHPSSLETIFVSIENIESGGNPVDHVLGAVKLSTEIPAGYEVIKFYPRFRRLFNFDEKVLVAAQLGLENNFGIGFDYSTGDYYIISGANIAADSPFSLEFAHNLTSSTKDASWILSFEYIPATEADAATYQVTSRTLEYNFESAQQVRFFFVNSQSVLDAIRNVSKIDEVSFHKSNSSHRSPIDSVTIDATPINLIAAPNCSIVSDGIGRNASILASLGMSSPGDLLTGGFYPAYAGGAFISASKMSTSGAYGVTGFISLTGGLFHDVNDTRNRNAVVSAFMKAVTGFSTAKEVYAIVVEDAGWGYKTVPEVTFDDVGQIVQSITLNDIGVDYEATDVLTLDGSGYAGTPATLTVDTIDTGGEILSATLTTQGLYTTNPTLVTASPASGGSGTGATFDLTMFAAAATRTASTTRMYVNDIIIAGSGFWYGPDSTATSTDPGLTLTANLAPSYQLGQSIKFNLAPAKVENDGYVDPKKVILTFTDDDFTGTPDNPNIFDMIVSDDILVFETYNDYDGYTYFRYNGDLVYDSGADDIKEGGATIATWDSETERYIATDSSGTEYYHKIGRAYSADDTLSFVWRHYAARDYRIDPSITNLIEIIILTKTHHDDVMNWVAKGEDGTDFPEPPTTAELRSKMENLEQHKAMSDQLLYRSTAFTPLFGARAVPELQAKIKAIKNEASTLSDNEVKSKIINAMDRYFDISLWDFGDPFYFTELAAYIHQTLATHINSVVLVPIGPTSKFGSLFQIQGTANGLFLNVATVNDIEIVDDLTEQVLRSG